MRHILGIEVQYDQGMKMDPCSNRLEIWRLGMSVDAEELWVLDRRIRSKPLSVLDLCGSSSAAYAVMRDLGFNIKQWGVVESNAMARTVAEAIFGDKVRHISDDIATFICKMFYDVVMASPPCQPWSRRNMYVIGFDDVRSAKKVEGKQTKRDSGTGGGSGGGGKQGSGGGQTDEQKSIAVYAREKKVDSSQVSLDRVKKDRGVAKWAAMWDPAGNPKAGKPKLFDGEGR